MTSRETRVHINAEPDEVFRFLSQTSNVPLFAPGIEEAHLVGGEEGLQGAWLGLRTRSGRELRAQITHYHDNESWTVVDERDTVSQIQVEHEPQGTRLTATLAGHWKPEHEKRVLAEWDRKVHDIAAHFR